MTNPHSVEHLLQSANHLSEADWQLATRYAPIIKFDAREPFLPAAVGYTIFRADAPSPSFPRQIELGNAALAIEYAVWWDWDIQHLYELEHVWVYLDEAGQVIRAEASWHGGYSEMTVDDTLPLTGDKLTIFSESGKHAFAPSQGRLNARADKTKKACTRYAGTGGVWAWFTHTWSVRLLSRLWSSAKFFRFPRKSWFPGRPCSRGYRGGWPGGCLSLNGLFYRRNGDFCASLIEGRRLMPRKTR